MTARPSFPASAKCAGPKSISPNPTARKRSKPSDCFLVRRSFDVLYLLAQFFNLRFDFEANSRNRERFAFHSGRFRKHGVRLAMHLLQQEIQLLAELARAVKQFPKLLQVAAQTVQLFADVAALGKYRRFLREPRRIERRAAQHFLQP